MKWLEIVQRLTPIMPLLLAAIPHGDKIAPVVPTILSGITEAEQIKGASGAEKKAHVLALVQDSVAALNATGKLHLDPSEMQAASASAIDTTVGVVNLVHAAHQPVPAGVLLPPSSPAL